MGTTETKEMKTLSYIKKGLFLTLLAFISLTLTAQSTDRIGKTTYGSWTSFRTSYQVMKFDINKETSQYFSNSTDKLSNLRGISVDYSIGISLSKKIPIYLEIPIGLTYASSNDEYTNKDQNQKVNSSLQFMSMYFPVNFIYRVFVGNSISISPYAGLKVRTNILCDYTYSQKLINDSYGDSEDVNMTVNLLEQNNIDKKYEDIGLEEVPTAAKKIQLGWQIGVNIVYNNFLVGVNYGSDFGEIFKGARLKTTQVSIGLRLY